jgi:nucleoside 2-deoxyribosyltransferase
MGETMKKTVFISGPIQGMENMQDYRNVIGQLCLSLGYNIIDPWQREKNLYNRDEPCWWMKVPAHEFVKRDLEDIDRSSMVIAYLPRLSAGTCMEIFYAKQKGKHVVVVSDIDCLSPWITVHADKIVKNFKELEEELKKHV